MGSFFKAPPRGELARVSVTERAVEVFRNITLSVLSLRSNPPLPKGEAKRQASGSLIHKPLAALAPFPQGEGFK